MLCQRCQKSDARVHDIEVLEVEQPEPPYGVQIHHFCEACAHSLQLPHTAPVQQKTGHNIWQYLSNAQMRPRRPPRQCPDCKMTEEELRRRGKVGCAKDYEIFADYLDGVLKQMHGATEHSGRIPGSDQQDLARRQLIGDLKQKLERAIREEDYECAASLRDELRSLDCELET